MFFNEFEPIFKRICRYFGKEEYITDKEMIEIYFNEMKRINDRYPYFEELLFQKCKFFPKVTEIRDIRFKMQDDKKVIDINTPICDCKLCETTGYRFIRNEKGSIYAVACDCKNGDNKLYDGRMIKDTANRSDYVIRRYSDYIPAEQL